MMTDIVGGAEGVLYRSQAHHSLLPVMLTSKYDLIAFAIHPFPHKCYTVLSLNHHHNRSGRFSTNFNPPAMLVPVLVDVHPNFEQPRTTSLHEPQCHFVLDIRPTALATPAEHAPRAA